MWKGVLSWEIAQITDNVMIIGSTDQESSQQLRTWFSEHFFAPNLLRSLSLVLFLLRSVHTIQFLEPIITQIQRS